MPVDLDNQDAMARDHDEDLAQRAEDVRDEVNLDLDAVRFAEQKRGAGGGPPREVGCDRVSPRPVVVNGEARV